MAATKTAKRDSLVRRLRESGPLRGRVDRQAGIIYGVKVVGRTSPNTHGVRGADGTEYTREALEGELPQIEGINVNVDHPPRERPDRERSARDRFAWIEEARLTPQGIYGDLHFLDPRDPLAVKMMNAAESKPDAYALSHNAIGRGEVINGRYVVTEIPEVRSVDIVADGGTNRSLFEGKAVQVRVCEVLRDKVLPKLRDADRKKRLESLLSTCLVEERSPLMEAEEGDKDHRDHMYTAMRACEDAGNDEAATGIHKLLHPDKRVEEDDESAEEGEGANEENKDKEEEEEGGQERERSEMEGEGEEGPGEGGANNEGPDGRGGPGTAWESRRRRKNAAGEIVLTEARALAMCRTAGVEATADVMEAIKNASFEQAMAVINLAKRSQTRLREASAPRSSGPLQRGAPAAPIPKNLKEWAESLKA